MQRFVANVTTRRRIVKTRTVFMPGTLNSVLPTEDGLVLLALPLPNMDLSQISRGAKWDSIGIHRPLDSRSGTPSESIGCPNWPKWGSIGTHRPPQKVCNLSLVPKDPTSMSHPAVARCVDFSSPAVPPIPASLRSQSVDGNNYILVWKFAGHMAQ